MLTVTRTDAGLVREVNEDSILADPSGLFIVADGMGGHRAGEVASSIAVDTLRELLSGALFDPGILTDAVSRTNSRVFEASQGNAEYSGMGTTLTLLWTAGMQGEPGVLIAQLGDSRAYLMRNSRLHRCTRDHSVVDEMLRKRLITPEQAKRHPERHGITRAIGIAEMAKPDLFEWDRQMGDIWLLCSDGLTDMLDDVSIASILRENDSLEDAADTLMREALNNGGHDNISLLLLYDDEGAEL
jgi:protein phosphatase